MDKVVSTEQTKNSLWVALTHYGEVNILFMFIAKLELPTRIWGENVLYT